MPIYFGMFLARVDFSFVRDFCYFNDVRMEITCAQVDFAGLTGPVKFDKFGLRRNFQLDVLEVSQNRGLAKVSPLHHCIRVAQCTG